LARSEGETHLTEAEPGTGKMHPTDLLLTREEQPLLKLGSFTPWKLDLQLDRELVIILKLKRRKKR